PLGVAVDVDGQGTCLACESLSRATDREGRPIEFLLADFLGVEKVIWLPEGRVRRRARFLRPGLVLAETDPDVLASLATTDARGRKLEVVTVPVPKRRDSSGLPVSYVDCVVADRVVVLPAFEEGRDEAALAGVTSALPDLRVFSFPAMDHAHGRCSLSGLVLSQPRGCPSKPAS
ncbi:MAG: agmatine deiminase family protein, partial [Rhodospirillales bacterium]|nr:agmatine deiminase family protein [Rhodospirillales bacterium]